MQKSRGEIRGILLYSYMFMRAVCVLFSLSGGAEFTIKNSVLQVIFPLNLF